jgi:hypothetical protein
VKSTKRGNDSADKRKSQAFRSVRGLRMQHRSVVMNVRQARGIENERHTMQARQTFLLRTKLRQVNMEYSALVRDRAGERRFVRMDELRTERRTLMSLLFGGVNSRPHVSQLDAAPQRAAD